MDGPAAGAHHERAVGPRVRRVHGDGAALLGQQALRGVEADRVDADGRTVLQHLRHAGQAAQLAGAVEHDDDPFTDLHPLARPRLLGRAGAGDDQRDQLGHPVRGARAAGTQEQRRRRLVRASRVRQPAQPVPVGLGALSVRHQHAHLDVARAVQHGELAHQPPGRATDGRGRTGDADDTELGERQHHRDLLEHRRRGAVGLLTVDDHEAGRLVGQSEPQGEDVVVVGPPLPQPPARTDRLQQHVGRVGRGVEPLAPLGGHRGGELGLDRRHRLGVRRGLAQEMCEFIKNSKRCNRLA